MTCYRCRENKCLDHADLTPIEWRKPVGNIIDEAYKHAEWRAKELLLTEPRAASTAEAAALAKRAFIDGLEFAVRKCAEAVMTYGGNQLDTRGYREMIADEILRAAGLGEEEKA